MKKLHHVFLSQTRQKFGAKVEKLKQLYIGACNDEALFHGQPAKVYRKCGKSNCKCVEGGDSRHGPYDIIRVYREGKNTQVTVADDEKHFVEMAKRYQHEVSRRKEIVTLQEEMLSMLDEIVDKRTIWMKEELKRDE